MDFLGQLADEVGGVMKPAGGKLIITKLGGAQSAGGQALTPIRILRDDCQEWTFDPDGRLQYGEVQASWTDKQTGKRRTVKEGTGLQGPSYTIKEEFPDEDRAKRAGKAQKDKLNQGTASGTVTLFGLEGAEAGASAILEGFRREVNGEWRVAHVEHSFSAGASGGFTTEIGVKPKGDGEKGSGDDD